MPDVIAIIPFRAREAGRLEGARHVLEALRRADGVQIVVVEQNAQATDLDADEHLLLSRGRAFNRSACFNAGALSGTARRGHGQLYFSDADVLCDPAALNEAAAALRDYGAVSPYDEVLDLSAEQTTALYAGSRPVGGQPRRGTNLAGGSLMMTRDAWLRVGGWDERIVGWGGEDDLMTLALERLEVRCTAIHHTAYHLWHDRVGVDWNAYRRNLEHLDAMRVLDVAALGTDARERARRLLGIAEALAGPENGAADAHETGQ